MVIYTKPRNEKKVAERLKEQGFEVFCPLIRSLRIWSDRKKKIWVPLFTSYVFVRVNELERLEVLKDHGVLNFVFWLGKPAIVREKEIDAIREIVDFSEDINVENAGFEKGQVLTIREGPFKGLAGEVVDLDRNIVYIYIEQLGCKIQFKYSKKFI